MRMSSAQPEWILPVPSDQTLRFLKDIRDNARLAEEFLGDLDVTSLTADVRTLYAIVRSLEIVSEAARRIDAEFTARHPEIAWADIRSAGNVYRHEYGKVSPRLVAATVRQGLPALVRAVAAEIERREASARP